MKEQINEAFFNFDTDKDGYISVEDLIVVMMTKGAKMSQQEVRFFLSRPLASSPFIATFFLL